MMFYSAVLIASVVGSTSRYSTTRIHSAPPTTSHDGPSGVIPREETCQLDPAEWFSQLSKGEKKTVSYLFSKCTNDQDCCGDEIINNLLAGNAEEDVCIAVSEAAECQPGFYRSNGTLQPCPADYFCPKWVTCKIPCTQGSYCPGRQQKCASKINPKSLVYDRVCRALGYCCINGTNDHPGSPPLRVEGNASVFCPEHIGDQGKPFQYLCPGPKENNPCPKGFYCELPDQKTVCPKGSFCRRGALSPYPCGPLTACKKGSGAPVVNLVGVLGLAILGVFILLCILFINQYSLWKRNKEMSLDDSEADVELLDPENQVESLIIPKDFTISFSFNELGLNLKNGGRAILEGVTGSIKSYHVTAVMGPSGAGKTTFLTTLMGKAYYGNQTGTVQINGKQVPIKKFKKICGFVPQEDVMHRNLTVHEVLSYQAQLRLPSSMNGGARSKKIKEVMDLLELNEIRDNLIGDEEKRGISGGQRKRVNIGMELVADPTVLFLDEPTSGLDSTSSFTVLKALKRIAAEGGLTVVTVLHQPRYEIFQMFDEVLFLGKGGRTVYLGPAESAQAYFQTLGFKLPDLVNPPDFYMDVIADPKGKDLVAEWSSKGEGFVGSLTQANIAHRATDENDYHPRVSRNAFQQAWVFFKREYALQVRMISVHITDCILLLLGAAVVGTIYLDANLSGQMQSSFMSALVFGLVTALAHLRVFGTARAVFWRESASGVNRLSYFVAANLANLPMQILSALVYLSIYFTLVSPRATIYNHILVFSLSSWSVSGMSYAISILVSPRNSQLVVTVLMLISGLLGGLNPTLKTMHSVPFLGILLPSLSFARWMMEALNQAEVGEYPVVLEPEGYAVQTRIGYTIGKAHERFSYCLGMLTLLGVGARLLAFVALLLCNRGAQQ
eukprot:m.126277 g.126277  ORF g.126277 m.126277 type:complete len:897 (-) comp14512_c0_seq3:966-3656(-)